MMAPGQVGGWEIKLDDGAGHTVVAGSREPRSRRAVRDELRAQHQTTPCQLHGVASIDGEGARAGAGGVRAGYLPLPV